MNMGRDTANGGNRNMDAETEEGGASGGGYDFYCSCLVWKAGDVI